VVIAAEPLTGTAEEARTVLDGLAKYLTDGGVLSVAVPTGPGRVPGAAAELDRQGALYGVGLDLVLRNRPPVRVHRLRFTPTTAARAARLAPVHRPSSVPLTRACTSTPTGGRRRNHLGLAAGPWYPRSPGSGCCRRCRRPVAAFRDQADIPETIARDGRRQ
jgi:phosphatidylserine decarboxylase